MRLIFLGPPGAGKGTQASVLAKSQDIPHISTGDILRQAIAMATPTGVEAKGFMDRGELVPFEIMLRLVRDRLKQDDAGKGWILDGFPRNLDQAKAFAEILEEAGQEIGNVVNFEVPLGILVERLCGRRTCKGCGAIFHTSFSAPKVDGVCDSCGEAKLYQRSDDQEEAIQKRLEVYEAETAPLTDFYKSCGCLISIKADESMEDVKAQLNAGLGIT